MKLTEKAVRELQVPEGKDEAQLFDPELPGFGVRKFASGKTFYFVKYSIGKQQRRKSLGPFVPGTLAAVRKEATVKAKLGTDAIAEAKKAQEEEETKKAAKTFGELISVYL